MAQSEHSRTQVRLPKGVRKLRVAAVISRYHEDLTGAMWSSAQGVLTEAGVPELEEYLVGGAFELPIVARRLALRDDVDAVLTFGLVLKGETTHDRYIAHAVSQALMQIGLETGTPVLFGVLTCDTIEQARARALPEGLDKGREVARAALDVLTALDEVAQGRPSRCAGFPDVDALGRSGELSHDKTEQQGTNR